jgi:hypothetical protein
MKLYPLQDDLFNHANGLRGLRARRNPLTEEDRLTPGDTALPETAREAPYIKSTPPPPSYASEHMRMKPLMAKVRELHAADANPKALFAPISAGFKVFCHEFDQPGGKRDFSPDAIKPIALVATVNWRWTDEAITGLDMRLAHNTSDIGWAVSKIRQLFDQAGMDMLPYYIVA